MKRLSLLLLLGLASPASAAPYSIDIDCSTCSTVTAQQANPFVQMIGVNTHLSYSGSSYNNTTTVLNALAYLNVYNIRDYALITGLANMPTSYNTVAAAGGKFIQEIGTGFACSSVSCVSGVLSSTFSNIDTFVTSYPGSVLAVEGPNEINNAGVQYTGIFTATGHSGSTINVSSTPAGLQAVNTAGYAGQVTLTDLTTGANIPGGTTMSSATGTTVVASTSVTVTNGDVIQYQATFQNPASGILWQQDIYGLTHADSNLTGLGVLNFTDFPQAGVSSQIDINNQHFYSQYGNLNQCPACLANFQSAYNASFNKAGAPLWVTETGYETCTGGGASCVDWTSVGPMVLNDLFDFYFIGCCGGAGFSGKPSPAMVFEYELLDEDNSGNGWGLFYSNGSPKASATGIKNAIAILSDPGSSFSPGSLAIDARGLNPGNGTSATGSKVNLLQKRNGTFEIILQNQQRTYDADNSSYVGCTNYSVTIDLENVVTTINVYDPITSASPINTYSGAHSVTVTSCMDPLIIEVIP